MKNTLLIGFIFLFFTLGSCGPTTIVFQMEECPEVNKTEKLGPGEASALKESKKTSATDRPQRPALKQTRKNDIKKADLRPDLKPKTKTAARAIKTKKARKTFEKRDSFILCEGDYICVQYLNFWFSEFLKRNNMTKESFDEHIEIVSAGVRSWRNSKNLWVSYKAFIDWAVIENADEFIIYLSSSEKAYQDLDIPKDAYLFADQIRFMLDRNIHSNIFPVRAGYELKYQDEREALKYLKKQLGNNELKSRGITFSYPEDRTDKKAYPYLSADGKAKALKNMCVYARVNLATGEYDHRKLACHRR